MAVTPDTEIRLIKSNLDLDENNQINFASASAQYTYFNSLTHLTIQSANYQRKDNYIRYPAHIDSIIQYNYCGNMYQTNIVNNKNHVHKSGLSKRPSTPLIYKKVVQHHQTQDLPLW